jgi:hypothetical protein
MTLIIGDKIEPIHKSVFGIEIEYLHEAWDDASTCVRTTDTWYGGEQLIEKLVKMLTAFQAIDKNLLADIDASAAILQQVADKIATNDRDPDRLMCVFHDMIPSNVFETGTWAQVSQFDLYWYNDNGEKHIVISSD